jgi:hypothetical protein
MAAGPPMTLANMREQGVCGLAVYGLNHACRHQTVISVDDYPYEIEVPPFGLRMTEKRSSLTSGVRSRAVVGTRTE